ncbi:MAG: 3-hydroxyacyl-CoA dehydrogenase family protein, partial [Gaiellaceae bacterium]
LASLAPGRDAIGYLALPDLESATLVELARSAATGEKTASAVERHFRNLGKHVEWVGDAPGLILGRIVSQLVNEAAFTLERGIGSAEDIDTAMRLGFNYPRGPLEWGEEIGLDRVLAILDALRGELGEERYRAAPLLRRMVAEGRLGSSTGAGFFSYS